MQFGRDTGRSTQNWGGGQLSSCGDADREAGNRDMIEVTNLTKRYGEHVAIDNLSFRVEKGQIYGFLGPNGAGKSTTMNILTGYIAASGGTVTIDGKDIQKQPEEAKKKIGYLPELPPLYMEMTVGEYLMFVAQLKKIAAKDRKAQIQKVMEMTQIADMRGRLIRNLSKGYRQRVGLAQAMLGDPEVIVLDEPSVGLDPKQIIEIRDLIRELGRNHTVILSSHILSEVSAVCDHIMIIAHGQLVASDSPEGLQKLMAGSMELQLTVKGDAEALKEALEAIPKIESVKMDTAHEPGLAKATVTFKEGADAREEVFYALAEAKLPVMEMIPVQKSLEDIFLELTEDVKPREKAKKGLFGGKLAKDARKGAEPGGTGAGEDIGADGLTVGQGVTEAGEGMTGAAAADTKEAQ